MGRPSHYKLTTTVLTSLLIKPEGEEEEMRVSGSLTRQKEDDATSDSGIFIAHKFCHTITELCHKTLVIL